MVKLEEVNFQYLSGQRRPFNYLFFSIIHFFQFYHKNGGFRKLGGGIPFMAKTGMYVGLDIGTTSVKVVVAEYIEGQMNIIGVGNAKSDGLIP
jgi:hypothetical protein